MVLPSIIDPLLRRRSLSSSLVLLVGVDLLLNGVFSEPELISDDQLGSIQYDDDDEMICNKVCIIILQLFLEI